MSLCFSVVFLLLLLSPNFLFANEAANDAGGIGTFIQQRALGPIKLQTGLPEAASRLTAQHELQIDLVHNNVFMGGITLSERLILDGESSQLNLRYRHRLNECWQFNVNGSLLAHSQGWFDQPVDDFHQFFGLPDAQRDLSPFDQLDYSYRLNGEQQTLAGEESGLGDAQIQVQRYLGCSPASTIVRFGVKLPLGKTETLTGNGAYDAFIDVQSPWQRSQRFTRLQWAGSLGVLRSGNSQFLAEQLPWIGFGALGLNLALTNRNHLVAQLDWHTSVFESELRELNDIGAQFTLGYRYESRNKGAFEFSFSEDLVIDTVPDIVFRLAWIARFGALR